MRLSRIVMFAFMLFLCLPAYSAPPQIIDYQGYLLDGGVAVTDTKSMSFSLYDAASGGSLLCSSGEQSVEVTKGLFSYRIGSGECDLSETDFENDVFLEISIEGTALSPREQIAGAAYSVQTRAINVVVTPAGDIASENVQAALEELDSEKFSAAGGAITGAVTLDGNLTASGTITADSFAGGGTSLTGVTPADDSVTGAKVADDSLAAADISDNIVSSVDGVSNDGGDIDLVAGSGITITPDDSADTITLTADVGAIDHGTIAGLGDDDHTQYFHLSQNETVAGRPAFDGGTSGTDSPFTVDSTTVVTNLNADLLDGQDSSSYLNTGTPHGGDVAGTYDNLQIGADTITATEIAADAVGASEIADGSIGSAELAADSVTATEIADGSVGAAEIAADAVTSAEIAADAVTSSEIASGAVGTTEIADGSIGTADIADGTVSAADLSVNVVSSIDGVTNDGGDIDLVAGSGITITPDDGADQITLTADVGAIDHGSVSGLGDDDHPQYVLGTGDSMTGDLAMDGNDISDAGTVQANIIEDNDDTSLSVNDDLSVTGGIAYTGALSSSVATGTAPIVVDSTTVATRLNADMLDGQHGEYYLNTSSSHGGDVSGTYDNLQLGADTITATEIAADAVGASEIADGSVGSAELAANAVTSSEIASGAVGTTEIADGSIGTADIADGTVSAADLSVNLVSSIDGVTNDGGDIDLVAGSGITITPDDGADQITLTADVGAIDHGSVSGLGDDDHPQYFHLSQNETVAGRPAFDGGTSGTDSPFTVDSTTVVTNLNADLLDGQESSYYLNTGTVHSGDVTGTYDNLQIGSGAVGSAEIADGVVSSTDLADGAALAEIADDDGAGSALDADLLDGIDSTEFVATATAFGGDVSGTYDNLQLGAGSVTANELAAGSVTAAEIASGAVGSAGIADTSVATGDVAFEFVGGIDGVNNKGGNIDLVAGSGITITPDDGANQITLTADTGAIDHSTISGLGDDDHTQYFHLSQSETVTGRPAFDGGTSGSDSPFTVDSTTVVTNLNADMLDGLTSSDLVATGTAFGGDVSGTYDNLQLGADSVGSTEIADGTVSSTDLADGAALAEIADDDGAGSALDADLLDGIDSTEFVATATAFGGDVSGTYDNLQIGAGAVGTAEVADGSLTAADLGVNVISSINSITSDGGNFDIIAGSNVTVTPTATQSVIVSAAVSGSGIDHNTMANLTIGDVHTQYFHLAQDETLTGRPAFDGGTSGTDSPFTVDSTTVVTNLNADLLDDYTSSDFVATATAFGGDVSGTYNNLQIGAGAVGSAEIADGVVSSTDLADGAALAEIADDDGAGSALDADFIDGIDSTDFVATATAFGGDVSGTYNNLQIGADSVGSAEIADGVVSSTDLADGAALAEIADDDGAGSALDADFIDGIDSAEFVATATAFGGDVSGTYDNIQIGAGAVGSAEIAATSVATGDVAFEFVGGIDGVNNKGGDIDLVAGSGITITPDDSADTITLTADVGAIDHGSIANLGADDHTQYFHLSQNETVAGRPAFDGGTSGTDSPFTVDSTYLVSNLNADLLDGNEASAFMTAATDNWVDTTGDTMSGVLDMDGNTINNVADPTAGTHAMDRDYADSRYVNDGCADCLNATEIEDIYVLNSGDTVSGSLTITGDLTVDTNTLTVDSSNNRVGVGTSPSDTFDVNGSIVVRGDSTSSVTGSGYTSDEESIRITGNTADYIIATQDGSGRIQHYWNSTTFSTTNKYLATGEAAWYWDLTISGDPYMEFKYAPSGTAGNDITWNTHMAFDSDGDITIAGRLEGVADPDSGDDAMSRDYADSRYAADGCTDCLNATEIEDIYVLNSGDTMSGALGLSQGAATATIHAYNTGTTAGAAYFRNDNASNNEKVVEIIDEGTGGGLYVQSSSTGGAAGVFAVTNASNSSTSLYASNSGTGVTINANKDGSSGGAGWFAITNASNSSNALTAKTSGTGDLFVGDHTGASGNLLNLKSSGASKFTVDKSGNTTTNGDLTLDKGQATINMGGTSGSGPHGFVFKDDGTNDLYMYYRTGPDELQIEDSGGSDIMALDYSGNLTLAGDLTLTGGDIPIAGTFGGFTSSDKWLKTSAGYWDLKPTSSDYGLVVRDYDDNAYIEIDANNNNIRLSRSANFSIVSNNGFNIDLDDNNNGSDLFKVRDGGKTAVMTVTEGGNVTITGSLTESCPSGMSGYKNYCIDINESGPADAWSAYYACINNNKRLCTNGEWWIACSNNGAALNNETGNWEWIDDANGSSYIIRGSGACSSLSIDVGSSSHYYRCCKDR